MMRQALVWHRSHGGQISKRSSCCSSNTTLICDDHPSYPSHTIPYHTIPYHTIPYHIIKPYQTNGIQYLTIPCQTIKQPYGSFQWRTICSRRHVLTHLLGKGRWMEFFILHISKAKKIETKKNIANIFISSSLQKWLSQCHLKGSSG